MKSEKPSYLFISFDIVTVGVRSCQCQLVMVMRSSKLTGAWLA